MKSTVYLQMKSRRGRRRHRPLEFCFCHRQPTKSKCGNAAAGSSTTLRLRGLAFYFWIFLIPTKRPIWSGFFLQTQRLLHAKIATFVVGSRRPFRPLLRAAICNIFFSGWPVRGNLRHIKVSSFRNTPDATLEKKLKVDVKVNLWWWRWWRWR